MESAPSLFKLDAHLLTPSQIDSAIECLLSDVLVEVFNFLLKAFASRVRFHSPFVGVFADSVFFIFPCKCEKVDFAVCRSCLLGSNLNLIFAKFIFLPFQETTTEDLVFVSVDLRRGLLSLSGVKKVLVANLFTEFLQDLSEFFYRLLFQEFLFLIFFSHRRDRNQI